ncbi:MAG: hypothetical protein KBT03_06110 [Bacteroidales bacterium]|nr:hypothetical protein [Candidatus Scybalousia scybalohippi]
MRKFYLNNANNEQIDLNTLEHFLSSPSGLGMEKKTSYEQVGDYFLTLAEDEKQKAIEGEIFFKTYEEYRKFVRFAEVAPLTLTYVTDDVYYIDVKLDIIKKTEKKVGGLYCKIKLVGISTFYKKYEMRTTSIESTGKKYNYEYNYEYTNSQASTVSFEVDSNKNCPTKIIIIGPAINPMWTYRLNDNIVATGKVNKRIAAGRRLVVDCTTIPYSIYECDNNGDNKEDAYQYSDFSTERFLMLKKGSNVIRVSHEGENDLNLVVERRELYATV